MSVKDGLAVIGIGVGGIAVLGGLIVGGSELSYRLSQHYAPRHEEVRRTTFEQSRAFNEGAQRQIRTMRIEWLGASGDRKAAIRSAALQEIYGLPEQAMTSDIIAFRNELESSQ